MLVLHTIHITISLQQRSISLGVERRLLMSVQKDTSGFIQDQKRLRHPRFSAMLQVLRMHQHLVKAEFFSCDSNNGRTLFTRLGFAGA